MRATWQTRTMDINAPDEYLPLASGRVFFWGGFGADGQQPGAELIAYDDGDGNIAGNVLVGGSIRYEDGAILVEWNADPPPGPSGGGTFVGTLAPAPDGSTRVFQFTTGADLSRGGNDGEGRLRLQITDLATPGVSFEDAYDNWNGIIHGESLDPEGVNTVDYSAGSGTITFITPPAAAAPGTFTVQVTNVATMMYAGWVFRVKTPAAPGLDKGLFSDHTGRLWGPPAAGSSNPYPTDRLDHLRGRYIASFAGSPIVAGRDMILTYDALTGVPPVLDIPIDYYQVAAMGNVNLTEAPAEVGFGGG